MHTYMDAMHVYMHTLMYILMHILIHTYAYPNKFHRILFIPCSHIIFHALHPLFAVAVVVAGVVLVYL